MTQAPEQQALATTVSNLVVTPQTTGVSISFTTNNAVRAQVQIGPSSGTYTTFTSGIESVVGTSHLLYAYGLTAGTLYHYILQFYGSFGGALDATADATFTTATAAAAAPTGQTQLNGPPAGGGCSVPLTAGAAIAASTTTVVPQTAASYASHGPAGVTMSGGKLTVQNAGFYSITATIIATADLTTTAGTYVAILLGGSTAVGHDGATKIGTNSGATASYVGNLAAGTTIEAEIVNATATATTLVSGNIGVGGIG